MGSKAVIVVGAGLGGLATALRLSHTGHRVTVLEKTDQVGGRNRRVQVGDCDFDGGPTLMMMLDPFRRLFSDVGERLEDHLTLTLCDPSYRVFYVDGTRLDGTPNVAKMVDQIRNLSGERDAQRYGRLLGDLAELYRVSVPQFVQRNYRSPLDLVRPKDIAAVMKHHLLANLARRIEKYVDDPRLRMLFTFQTMYLGLSPYDAPWVYGVLTYMEYGEGIWYPKGGLPAITEKVAELAESRGTTIRLNAPVAEIKGNQVLMKNGEVLTADYIVCNADLPYARRELTKRPIAPKRSSCSAYLLYVDYAGGLPDLLHHNVFFGADFRGNLESIFHEPLRMPEDPAFYACVSARTEADRAPEGHENLFLLVPVPNCDYPISEQDEGGLREAVFGRLKKEVGFEPQDVRTMRTYGPRDWANDLNLDRGAAFGLSHDFLQSVCFRPSNQDTTNPHLFYVGASTTPGNGLPMVLISAELVVERMGLK
ncbi:MAG: phytoene desaturase [Fimbriimonadaceae bacterium]|nr:phytoene desaturase [Fimbriimonadaceae bacterium]